jgi:hypothetical protein
MSAERAHQWLNTGFLGIITMLAAHGAETELMQIAFGAAGVGVAFLAAYKAHTALAGDSGGDVEVRA